MSQLFDLDVQNYSLRELLDFFELTSNDDGAMVDRNCRGLKQKIQGDPKLGPMTKTKIHAFLDAAIDRLSQSRAEVNDNKYTKFMDVKTVALDNRMSGAQPGLVNPIATSTIKLAMNVDTRFRNNYYATKSTDFTFTIPYLINNVVRMSVAAYEIPLTYYAISQHLENNCMLFMWDSGGSLYSYGNQYTLIIPDGNYTPQSIATTINSILAGTALVNQTGVAFSVDKTSGRSIFACNSVTTDSYSGAMRIVFNVKASSSQTDAHPLPYFFGWQLGFRTAMYEMRGQAAVSEGICLITGPNYLFMCIDDYNNNVNNYYTSAFGSSIIAPNIIARLNTQKQLNSAGPYTIMSGELLSTSLTFSREYFGPVDIQRIHIRLLDEYGRVIDLNNMDWSFALMFESVYGSSSAG
jgi:hypothetical protein